MTIANENELLKVNEVMGVLRLSRNKVYELIREGHLRAYRMNSTGKKDKHNRKPWRVKQGDLNDFINKGMSVSSARTGITDAESVD